MEAIIKNNLKEYNVSVIGRLDTQTSPELEEKLSEIKDFTLLVLDFSKLDYISSAGLRLLLKLEKLAKSLNAKLEIININDVVKEIFSVTGFDKVLTIK